MSVELPAEVPILGPYQTAPPTYPCNPDGTVQVSQPDLLAIWWTLYNAFGSGSAVISSFRALYNASKDCGAPLYPIGSVLGGTFIISSGAVTNYRISNTVLWLPKSGVVVGTPAPFTVYFFNKDPGITDSNAYKWILAFQPNYLGSVILQETRASGADNATVFQSSVNYNPALTTVSPGEPVDIITDPTGNIYAVVVTNYAIGANPGSPAFLQVTATGS